MSSSFTPLTITLLFTLVGLVLFLPTSTLISARRYPDSYQFEVPTEECPFGYRRMLLRLIHQNTKKYNIRLYAALTNIATDYAQTSSPPGVEQIEMYHFQKGKPYHTLQMEITWPEVPTSPTVTVKRLQIVELFSKKLQQIDGKIWKLSDDIAVGFGCHLTVIPKNGRTRSLLRLTAVFAIPKPIKHNARSEVELQNNFYFTLPTEECPFVYNSALFRWMEKDTHLRDAVYSNDLSELAARYVKYLQRSNGKRLVTFHRYRTVDIEIRWPEVLTVSPVQVEEAKVCRLFNQTLYKVMKRSSAKAIGFGCQLATYQKSGETILRLVMLIEEREDPSSPAIKVSTKTPTARLPLVTCPAPPPCPVVPTCPIPAAHLSPPTCPPPKVCPSCPTCPAPPTCPPPPPVNCPAPASCPPPKVCPTISPTNTAIWSIDTAKLTNGQMTLQLLLNLRPRCLKKKKVQVISSGRSN